MMWNSGKLQQLLLCVLAVTSCVNAASVLSVGAPGGASHHMNLVRVGKELAKRGHNFTVLVSQDDIISRRTIQSRAFPELQVVTFNGPPGAGSDEWAASMSKDPQESLIQLFQCQKHAALYLHQDNATVQQLRSAGFDMILWDACFWPGAFFQDLLGIPSSVELFPTAMLMPWYWESEHSIPNPVAYAPQVGLPYTPNMGFWQRLRNYLQNLLVKTAMLPVIKAHQADVVKKTGHSWSAFETGVSSSAAVIAVGDWTLELPQPMTPKMHMVGPILLEDAKPVPPQLDYFLNQGVSGQHGVVYVNMGTLARLTEAELWAIAEALTALPNPALWRLDEASMPGNMTWKSLRLPERVKLIAWGPQTDILAHPGVKAFVTQSGINGLYEAAHHAVPMVAIPYIGDQINNAAKAEHHGISITVTPQQLIAPKTKHLQRAISRTLGDPIFQDNAQKVASRMQNRPRHPAELAADVVERVLLTQGDDYLVTPEHKFRRWQLALLDVKIFLLLLVGLLGLLLWAFGRWAAPICVRLAGSITGGSISPKRKAA